MKNRELAEFLLNASMPFAEKMLRLYGGFYPYGALVSADYTIIDVGASNPTDPFPNSQALFNTLLNDFQRKAKDQEIIACVILLDVKVTHPKTLQVLDAIQANIDCIENFSVEVFKPYVRSKGLLEFMDLFSQKGKNLMDFQMSKRTD